MSNVQANGITIEYEFFGKPADRPLILIMGLATQMIGWPDRFCEMLAKSGHFVIRFDNRDVGLSTKMEHLGIPNLNMFIDDFMAGNPVKPPYLLSDMAADTVGLMDTLNISKANVCGISMGGMIAQIMAVEYPQRMISLISMASSTSEMDLPDPTPEALQAMMSSPPMDREGYIDYSGQVHRAFAGGSDKYDEALQKEMSAQAYDRSFYPEGFPRQMAAMIASGGRRQALKSVIAPTLVIHGDADTLVPLEHGQDTANAIPGAKLKVVGNLGHGNAYPELWPEIVTGIADQTRQAED
jgi:pimeloyl-ACP methyl ester carboxylesterase